MTIIKALAATIQVPGVSPDTLEKACLDAGLVGGENYNTGLEKNIDLAAANVLNGLVISTMSEGGFSFGIATDVLKKRISFLRDKWGALNETQPLIRNSNAW